MLSVLKSEADSFVPRAAFKSQGASLSFLGFEQLASPEQDQEKSLEMVIAETLKANLGVSIAAAATSSMGASRSGAIGQ